jgi:hypothetical protein
MKNQQITMAPVQTNPTQGPQNPGNTNGIIYIYILRSIIDVSNYNFVTEIIRINRKTENRSDPDLVQAFLKKRWVESDFKAPNLPLSLRLKSSGCHYNSMTNTSSTTNHTESTTNNYEKSTDNNGSGTNKSHTGTTKPRQYQWYNIYIYK